MVLLAAASSHIEICVVCFCLPSFETFFGDEKNEASANPLNLYRNRLQKYISPPKYEYHYSDLDLGQKISSLAAVEAPQS